MEVNETEIGLVSVVSPNHNLFATCSNDGTCRIWNPARWEINHQDPLNASGCVVLKKGAQVKSIAFISNECIIACCHDSLQAIEVDRAAALSNEARGMCMSIIITGVVMF